MLIVSPNRIQGAASAGADLLLFDSRGLPPRITPPMRSLLDQGPAILWDFGCNRAQRYVPVAGTTQRFAPLSNSSGGAGPQI